MGANDFFTIAYETSSGLRTVFDGNDKPCLYGSEQETAAEIASDLDFYDGCFPMLLCELLERNPKGATP